MKISLIHPSRSRPIRAMETAKKWVDNSGVPNDQIEHIFSLDSSDPDMGAYYLVDTSIITINENRSAVDAINKAAKIATGDIFIVVSDDFDCPENWAVQILEAVKGKVDWIAKTPDGIQKWIITLPIMDRAYYNRFGYIYHPDYLHMFCDTELTCVADLTGRKIELNIPFKHNHYSVTNEGKDAVSIKADSTWNQGENLFLSRAKERFGIIGGSITDIGYLNWMRSKGVLVSWL